MSEVYLGVAQSCSCGCLAYSRSAGWIRNSALGKRSMLRMWSQWACVRKTTSMSLGAMPSADRRCSKTCRRPTCAASTRILRLLRIRVTVQNPNKPWSVPTVNPCNTVSTLGMSPSFLDVALTNRLFDTQEGPCSYRHHGLTEGTPLHAGHG